MKDVSRNFSYPEIPAKSRVSGWSSLVGEPKLHADFASNVIRWQRSKSVNPLQRPDGRLIKRGHAARLLNLYVRRPAVALDIERQIKTIGVCDARINLILEPILGYFLVYPPDIPGVT